MQAVAAAPVFLNREELAYAEGVSLPTVDRWIKADCPVEEKGGNGRPYKFSLVKVRAWRRQCDEAAEAEDRRKREHIAQLSLPLEGGAVREEQRLNPKDRTAWLQAELLSNKARRERGELVEAMAVEAEFRATFKRIRIFLQSLPDALQRDLPWLGASEVAQLQDMLDRFQEDMARKLMERGGDDG